MAKEARSDEECGFGNVSGNFRARESTAAKAVVRLREEKSSRMRSRAVGRWMRLRPIERVIRLVARAEKAPCSVC